MLHNYSIIVSIPAIILLFSVIVFIRLKIIHLAGILLFAIYIGSTVSAIFVDPTQWYPYFNERAYTPEVMMAYGLLILFCLWPALRLVEAPPNLSEFKPPWLKAMMWIMIIGGAYAIIYQLPYALQAAAVDADDFRREMDQNLVFLLPSSPATTLAVFFSTFYMLHIALAFQSSIIGDGTVRTWLLWLTSFANVVSGATFATRDASVFYIFALIFNYVYFRNAITKNNRKYIKGFIISIMAIMVINTAYISLERFSNYTGNTFSWGTVGYFTSQPYTFAEAVYSHVNFYHGDLRFPVVKMLFNDFNLPVVVRTANYETMFGTFLKDFYNEGGWPFLIFGVMAICLIFKMSISANRNRFLSEFVAQSLYIQLMFTGIFYFVLGSKQGNYYVSIMFLLYFVCRRIEVGAGRHKARLRTH